MQPICGGFVSMEAERPPMPWPKQRWPALSSFDERCLWLMAAGKGDGRERLPGDKRQRGYALRPGDRYQQCPGSHVPGVQTIESPKRHAPWRQGDEAELVRQIRAQRIYGSDPPGVLSSCGRV
jgi:hypothetical protein